MALEFDHIKNLPVLNIGDIKNNVGTCKIYVVSHRDEFIYSIGIEYLDDKEEKYKIGFIGGSISFDVSHKDGMATSSWTYPIDPFISKEEIILNMSIIPYVNKSGNIEPAILELKKQEIKEGRFIRHSFPSLNFS